MTKVKYWGNPYVILSCNIWEGTMRHATTLSRGVDTYACIKYCSVAILLTVVSSSNTKGPFLMPNSPSQNTEGNQDIL